MLSQNRSGGMDRFHDFDDLNILHAFRDYGTCRDGMVVHGSYLAASERANVWYACVWVASFVSISFDST